ncbi:LysM peptidoglycan-binding domain-containing protein [Sinomicrobium pectinilyticum]|uniref:LysM peptidoglycan-binding domain-containing protein n=1 Tax=Sinomicrobium pectinilyticum TaxID=1084421 RepID=A0A3N0EV09_SINP1|nr:LysM peptidoglycan-binding domain-containing protein [Sinomicrobium pectinilyticum]RNL91720.1 LysM peptidoglycan-binding domain-containing protein [Sinomicrobium pectinilyticum]
MSTGELEKLKVVAYSDPEFNNKVGDGEFTTLLNPEKYTYHYKTEQNDDQASGTSAAAPKFNKKLPEELELEFVFDRTGVITGHENTDDGIIDDLEAFKKVVLDYDGEEHKPNYLMIAWGSLLFKGAMTQMDIEFKLFKPDGTPIRAVAKGKFKGFVEDNLRAAKENNQSPDLTHYRIVRDGDTLPLMTYRIYGDPRYYLEVARVNKLDNFRKLKTGQELFFPPLQKSGI